MGSLDGHPNANVCRDTVKFRGWLSPQLFQQHFPAHHAAILDALPLKEYINPECGILNLALKLPNEMPMANLGPCIYLTYGAPEELAQANFLTRLSYESYDVVCLCFSESFQNYVLLEQLFFLLRSRILLCCTQQAWYI